MKRAALFLGLAAGLALTASAVFAGDAAAPKASADWSMNATIIEACSCPMFCQCYFAKEPAGHAGHSGMAAEHYCRANNVFQVNKGNYGLTKLDGAKFWISMDLGDDFADNTMKWAVVTFDPSVTKPQRDGILAAITNLYPVKWETPVKVADDLPIEWSHNGDKAVARLNGGKAGEVVLDGGTVGRNKTAPVVINNLKYWGAPRNDGFVLMPNEVEAYRLGPNAFEFKGTNGFMITVDITSKDVASSGN